MTDVRRELLKRAKPDEVLGWMERNGAGYLKAARHFANEALGTNADADDVKYLKGRFHRWHVAKKKRESSTPQRDTAQQLANTLVGGLPSPPSARSDDPFEDQPGVPGSLADLAVEGSEEEWLVGSLKQIENAVAKRLIKGHDITGIKGLASTLRTRLGELRKPPMPSLDELPENERQAILEAEVPSWPTYVLEAARVELDKREADDEDTADDDTDDEDDE